MGTKLSGELISAIKDEKTYKVLATSDEDGSPRVIFSPSLHIDENGNLVHLELIESSGTNKNLVRGIWFDKKISVSVRTPGGREWSISGTPIKTHIAGALFQKHYAETAKHYGDADLAAVWIIKPETESEETHNIRLGEQDREHPYFRHLDRLA